MRDSMKLLFALLMVVGGLAGCATTVEMGGPLAYYRYSYNAPSPVVERYEVSPPVVRRYETVVPSVTYYSP